MSKYTTEIRFICETEAGLSESAGYTDIDSIVTLAAPKIFSFSFPILRENHRLELEKKILKHYYTREICEETYGLWKLRLDARMNEIMPQFNRLYEALEQKYNPLFDVDYTKEGNRQGTGTEQTSGGRTENRSNSGSATSLDAYSDTPQGAVSDLEALSYLSNARQVTGSNSGSEEATSSDVGNRDHSTEEAYTERIYGKMSGKSYAEMLKEYTESVFDVDMLIIKNLADLFINLW